MQKMYFDVDDWKGMLMGRCKQLHNWGFRVTAVALAQRESDTSVQRCLYADAIAVAGAGGPVQEVVAASVLVGGTLAERANLTLVHICECSKGLALRQGAQEGQEELDAFEVPCLACVDGVRKQTSTTQIEA